MTDLTRYIENYIADLQQLLADSQEDAQLLKTAREKFGHEDKRYLALLAPLPRAKLGENEEWEDNGEKDENILGCVINQMA